MSTVCGDCVFYYDATYYDDLPSDETKLRDIPPCPALVTRVNDDGTLELTVFPIARAPRVKSRVAYDHAPNGDAVPTGALAVPAELSATPATPATPAETNDAGLDSLPSSADDSVE